MKIKPLEKAVKRHSLGVMATPAISCPICQRKTKAEVRCQWCKKEWTPSQQEMRKQYRRGTIKHYPKELQSEIIRKFGDLY